MLKVEQMSEKRLAGLKDQITLLLQEQFLAYKITDRDQLMNMLEVESQRVL